MRRRKKERICAGFRAGIRLEIGYWLFIGVITTLFRRPIVSMFVAGDGSAEVIRYGSEYLAHMALFYLWPALTNGVQGFFRGMGKCIPRWSELFFKLPFGRSAP